VVIDSLSEIQTFIIKNITGGQRMPQKNEWSDFGYEMTKILRAYRDLPMHVIFLALETDRGGEEEGDKSVFMPDLYGKVRTNAAAFMDFVGRMAHYGVQEGDAKVAKRGICFTHNERFVAKDRSGKLPVFVEPDFTKMLELVGTIQTGEGKVIETINPPTKASPAQKQGKIIDLARELDIKASEACPKWPPTDEEADRIIADLQARLTKKKEAEMAEAERKGMQAEEAKPDQVPKEKSPPTRRSERART